MSVLTVKELRIIAHLGLSKRVYDVLSCALVYQRTVKELNLARTNQQAHFAAAEYADTLHGQLPAGVQELATQQCDEAVATVQAAVEKVARALADLEAVASSQAICALVEAMREGNWTAGRPELENGLSAAVLELT